MAILNNSNAISSGGYDINNSVRLRNSATAYFNRTNSASAPTNNKIGTISCWVKRGALGSGTGNNQYIMETGTGTSDGTFFNFLISTSDVISLSLYNVEPISTTQVFRDPSAWYHFVVAFDSTQATGSNRIKFYVNGAEATGITRPGDIPLNTNFAVLNASQVVNIGRHTSVNRTLDGYLAEFNIIDGQALTPSSFGETDTTTGSWKPKAYTGTYGNKGVYLKFSDIATTSGSNAGLGKDFSGNANYWNTNNISVTAGTTYDAMIDSPTLTSATVANYAVLNPVDKSSNQTFAQANLYLSAQSGAGIGRASIAYPSTGKWYLEWTYGSLYNNIGISTSTTVVSTSYCGAASTTWGYYNGDGKIYNNASGTTYGATWTTGDVIGVAFDSDAGTLTFYKNNVSQGTAVSGLTPSTIQYFFTFGNDSGMTGYANFGQRPFSYTPPTGYNRLNTYNLPDSTIKKGNTVMDATIYSGNSTNNRSIVNEASFRPDFVWIKPRNNPDTHQLYDSVRGAGNNSELQSNSTAAEGGNNSEVYGYMSAFNSTGFTVTAGTDSSFPYALVNMSGRTYVGWQWQAGQGSTSSNTSGSITSTVSVNTTAGFSIVTYTGTGANATVGHGLGVAPKMIIIKNRGIGTAGDGAWQVYHASIGNTQYLSLNTTAAAATATNRWNNTSPTSTVFTVATTGAVNDPSNTYVAYCWAEIAGFSKFGSYTGNGSADGTFVYTGFRPKFVIIKNTSGAGNWITEDAIRNTYNPEDLYLLSNSAQAENSLNPTMDFTANGFKIRAVDGNVNTSTSIYIYMAFAENPFKNANAR